MTTIRISDLDEGGCLAFDLVDLLALIGEDAVESRWICRVEGVVPKEGVKYLDRAFFGEHTFDGSVLFQLASNTLQILEGTFQAFRLGDKSPWLTLEAFDTTWWDVSTEDSTVVDSIVKQFRKVETLAGK